MKKLMPAGTMIRTDIFSGVIWKDCEAELGKELSDSNYSVIKLDKHNIFPIPDDYEASHLLYDSKSKLEILTPRIKGARRKSLKIGFTCGTMDVLHAGHSLMLQEAKSVCDFLVVGVQYDPTQDRPEKNSPVMSYEERIIMALSNKFVDEVILYSTETDLLKLLAILRPDIRILGADHFGKEFTGHELDIECYFNTRDHNWSSTNLRRDIFISELNKRGNFIGKKN